MAKRLWWRLEAHRRNAGNPQKSGPLVVREDTIEYGFIGTLQRLKYEYRRDITDRAAFEANFREKFEALNRVRLTDAEFGRTISRYMVLIASEQNLPTSCNQWKRHRCNTLN